MGQPIIRPACLADLPGVYRVCFTEGFPGEDRDDGRNPDLLGHVYAGPYVVADPDLCAVVVDVEGVAGYVLGTPDAVAFAAWQEHAWWPPLREQYPLGACAHPADAEVVALLHAPEVVPPGVYAGHPAQLHIDLLERIRGTGLGRVLIAGLLGRLHARGVPGVHLPVAPDNTHAIGFYRHLGFVDALAQPDTLWMTRSTTP
ncbi:MAG: GNAT family N-acetyltransferase [Nocardioidaceae bacterium]